MSPRSLDSFYIVRFKIYNGSLLLGQTVNTVCPRAELGPIVSPSIDETPALL